MRRSEDAFVDGSSPAWSQLGAPLMTARFPRAYLDVNREPYELDPRMFEGRLPAFANTRSLRVAGGLGTIARIVAEGQEIYARAPAASTRRCGGSRVSTSPITGRCASSLSRTARRFGIAVLIDCHSMPSTSLARRRAAPRPTSCSATATARAAPPAAHRPRRSDAARGAATRWRATSPMPAASSPSTTASPAPASSLQIEINRALYMDERTLAPQPAFETLANDLKAVFAAVIEESEGDLVPPPDRS